MHVAARPALQPAELLPEELPEEIGIQIQRSMLQISLAKQSHGLSHMSKDIKHARALQITAGLQRQRSADQTRTFSLGI